jgi:hypothetical protein
MGDFYFPADVFEKEVVKTSPRAHPVTPGPAIIKSYANGTEHTDEQ